MATDKINIFIAEDEGITAFALKDTLTTEGYHVEGLADNGEAALQLIKQKPFDLALLDIHLKGKPDGIEIAGQLRTLQNIPFIFLTAYSDDETVARARNTRPSAYLIKPYQTRHLLITIDLALHNFALQQNQPIKSLPMTADEDSTPSGYSEELLILNHAIFIKQNKHHIKVRLEDILYLEANGNYTHIFTSKKRHIIRQSLGEALMSLDERKFLRIHRSFVVNLSKVSKFSRESVFIGMDTELPIGRHYKEDFLLKFK